VQLQYCSGARFFKTDRGGDSPTGISVRTLTPSSAPLPDLLFPRQLHLRVKNNSKLRKLIGRHLKRVAHCTSPAFRNEAINSLIEALIFAQLQRFSRAKT
jgi:hypothetical protein